MTKIQLGTEDIPTQVEALLQLSAEIGVEGVVLFGAVLALYLVTGVLLTTILGLNYPYQFFSLRSDPVLLIDGTIIGVFTIQGAGSLLLYHLSTGIDNRSVSSVALSFVGIGLGGAVLQLTVPRLLAMTFNVI